MDYTEEQIALFANMFDIQSEYTAYSEHTLSATGLVESTPNVSSYNTGEARITLTNGETYAIWYGDSDDAEGRCMDAFQKFIELKYDEYAFEKYLDDEGFRHE